MSEMQRLTITAQRYVNASAGQSNCYLSGEFGELRLVIASSEPDPGEPDYILLASGKPIAFEALGLEDQVWLRAEDEDETVAVLRGSVRMRST